MAKSVYIHIPFCTNKCYYCDFNSYVTQNEQIVWDYLEALVREMEATVQNRPPQQIRTIYVGGGTPTFLNAAQMAFFLEKVNEYFFPFAAGQLEFTMEANPGTVDREKLALMREGGVNRISFGAQSFDDRLLRNLGRIHDAREVERSVALAREAGFDNLSLDLMFGLPEQTPAILRETLQRAFALDLEHYSAYSLKVEENTLFHTWYEKGELALPEEEEELAMYLLVIEEMERRGYRRYEISNFAKPGFESRHNMTYWRNDEYYGLGAGAHGYVDGRRHVNAGPLQRYLALVRKNGLPRVEEFSVSERERMEDHMILGLRLREGVSRAEFRRRYGRSLEEVFGDEVEELLHAGLLEEDGDFLRLTEKGLPLGNEVFARFLS
ncbi:radical SAM family heme chaperone HemW [Bacillaceae bacterium]